MNRRRRVFSGFGHLCDGGGFRSGIGSSGAEGSRNQIVIGDITRLAVRQPHQTVGKFFAKHRHHLPLPEQDMAVTRHPVLNDRHPASAGRVRLDRSACREQKSNPGTDDRGDETKAIHGVFLCLELLRLPSPELKIHPALPRRFSRFWPSIHGFHIASESWPGPGGQAC